MPTAVDVSDLDVLFPDGGTVTPDRLREHGLLTRPDVRLHITATGPAEVAYEVHAHSFTRTAVRAIRSAGGRVRRIR